ncbi:hypothetical protein O181_033984 [Austropuccinia psidii MF-1]|uniref:Uncharacterized protein n=1 Tax=Austropuccinia psidii MF-1 TaxID=1389203 RepID=A0A9Q3D031_9BASI|nr:hypothetical protein [Austropuccinia psidii MF-1]
MMLLTAEWWKNNPPPSNQVQKTAPIAGSSHSNIKKQPQAQKKGKGKAPATKSYIQGYRIPTIHQDAMEKRVSDGKNYDGITEKGGSQIKISEIIYDILGGIPNLYIAKNDVKRPISDKNSSIFDNINTNNLSLSQINETLMCFEKGSGTIKTSNNEINFVIR